jgi:hypothetical protein
LLILRFFLLTKIPEDAVICLDAAGFGAGVKRHWRPPMRFRKAACLLIAVFLFAPAVRADDRSPYSLGIRLGFFGPSSTTLNQEWMKARNADMTILGRTFSALNYAVSQDNLLPITDNTTFGGEFEYRFGNRMALVIGAEYVRFKRTGSVKAYSIVDGNAVSADFLITSRVSALPLTAGVKKTFTVIGVDAYIGAGAGYYLSRLSVETDLKFEGPIIGIPYRELTKGAGGAFVPHVTLGIDFPVADTAILSAEVRIPFGTVNSYTIKDREAVTFTEDVGDTMTFIDRQGLSQAFKWELTGIHAGLVLKWMF